MTSAKITTHVNGHVKITDKMTGETLLDKDNAVHNKNMAIAIARGLSNDANQQIYKMKFGNGGSYVSGLNTITYQEPRVTGAAATLYNQTYEEVIDDAEASTAPENSVTYQESPAPDVSTIVICTCTIAANQPAGQDPTDSTGDPNSESQYAFDELGLFTSDDRLLTHIIFSPILKTSNRELVITYTLTVSVS